MSAVQLEKVSILRKETIWISHGLWLDHVSKDLLQNVKSDPSAAIKFALVTDTNLHDTYVPAFKEAFEKQKKELGSQDELLTYTIPPGENSKSRDTVGAIHDWLAKTRCTKDAVVIALGGGVVGDMVGYAAATYMRGISVVQVPTTLLSMVDSSVGGKTAIDTPYGKNLVGAFWQPKRVYIDLRFLVTLPKREVINGMAEIIKTAAIWNAQEFVALEENAAAVMQYLEQRTVGEEPPAEIAAIFKRMIRESVKVKAHVVTEDEKEGGLRNLLNFGHSIGHGMEAILAPQILHGECVAVGMVREAELSRYLGHLSASAVARLTKCLISYSLPISLQDKLLRKRSANRLVPVEKIISIMAVDKKNAGGKKRIVLLSEIGKTYEPKATVVSDDDIRVILADAVKVHAKQTPKSVVCTPPGSKSISNRALILAALGSGKCRINNLLHSDDTQVMIEALTNLQAAKFAFDGETLIVEGNGSLQASSKELYLGNAGTASRFLTAAASLAQPGEAKSVTLTGNSRMKERPVGPLVDSLRTNGVNVEYIEREGSLPLKIEAGTLQGGEITLAATVSSQYVSALLMCAPYAKSPVTLKLDGKPVSQPYIDMTISMMASFGVEVKREEHTYYIPKQKYKNPAEYTIESDASSATYPLAIAAITGTTCTIPNIGSASLQGDARFATDVLKPMGCKVEQTATSTTVTGPASLKALPQIDMEPMTDAFLTASVLAAVAKGKTRITGIANQRVKECDRIKAMHDQLAKFGITSVEHDDGIEVEGGSLKQPTGVHCYDDHRVAMSFSVLALASPAPVVIEDKHCTAKTWPAWWDTLKSQFNASLEGVVVEPEVNGVTNGIQKERSIFLIGMRGAGKTTAGRWAAPVLGWPFLDLDEELERRNGIPIKVLVEQQGWAVFRQQETELLNSLLKEKPYGYVFACGGGIIETPENRKTLKAYHAQGGLVILIHRSVEKVIKYLEMDKTRPVFVDDMMEVWLRRKPWYQECSNHQYNGSNVDILGTAWSSTKELAEKEKFAQFIRLVTGRSSPLQSIQQKDRSFFVVLTLPHLNQKVLYSLRKAVVGADAVELRVDLLEDPECPGIPSMEFVVNECAFLKSAVQLPLIFTIRTKSQGGRFPDDAHKEALVLYRVALRMGFEFVDLEMTWPAELLDTITAIAGRSKIIGSHHDPEATLSWSTGAWIPYYNRALQYGQVVKLVGSATSMSTNDELESFRKWAHDTNPSTPLIAMNMGTLGKLSRVRNTFLTPVSHPVLPFKAAPGQLSAAEVRQAMALIGELAPKQFYIFGKPIRVSRSPALHNYLFGETGLPHAYRRRETDDVKEIESIIRAPDFGGASVTIPLKLDIMTLLDEIAPDAKFIGAVNTIVPTPGSSTTTSTTNQNPQRVRLSGHNTDWMGMRRSLLAGGAVPGRGAGLVIGSGGTSRAAVYCLHEMGYYPIYLTGRTLSRVNQVAGSFPADYNVKVVVDRASAYAASMHARPVTVAIGSIPADRDIDEQLQTILDELFCGPGPMSPTSPQRVYARVLLEMAYKPRQTQLMALAEESGWQTVPGLEALTAQGVGQFELWTGIDVEGVYEGARAAVLGAETEDGEERVIPVEY